MPYKSYQLVIEKVKITKQFFWSGVLPIQSCNYQPVKRPINHRKTKINPASVSFCYNCTFGSGQSGLLVKNGAV